MTLVRITQYLLLLNYFCTSHTSYLDVFYLLPTFKNIAKNQLFTLPYTQGLNASLTYHQLAFLLEYSIFINKNLSNSKRIQFKKLKYKKCKLESAISEYRAQYKELVRIGFWPRFDIL